VSKLDVTQEQITKDRSDWLKGEIDRLYDENAKLREALAFYAMKKHIVNMDSCERDPDGDFHLYDVNFIEEGGVARAALEETK